MSGLPLFASFEFVGAYLFAQDVAQQFPLFALLALFLLLELRVAFYNSVHHARFGLYVVQLQFSLECAQFARELGPLFGCEVVLPAFWSFRSLCY